MLKSKKGFTLIELVIVIVILGLLAAIAIPRYISITHDARIATVTAMGGGLRGAVALARAKYMVVGNNTAVTVDMDGVLVDCAAGTGIPDGTATGIERAMQDTSGFTITHLAGVSTFLPTNGGDATTCRARYTGATGVVDVVTTGC